MRVVCVGAGAVVVGRRGRVGLVGVVRVAVVVPVAGVVVCDAVLVVVVVDFELRLAGRRAVVVVVGGGRGTSRVRVLRWVIVVGRRARGGRVMTRIRGRGLLAAALGCWHGLLAAALGTRDGHPTYLKLLSLRRWPCEECADVQTHVLVGTLRSTKVGTHAAARGRQERIVGNQALTRLGVKHPRKGLGVVGTAFDLDGVLRILLEVEAGV